MITKIKETNEIIKHKNIDEASNNFKNISSKVKNQKFEHIDAWLLKTSKHFKTENSILQKHYTQDLNTEQLLKLISELMLVPN